jgi:endonuclease/exonuclease/phosphatase family metal-dependent hydrolase
MAKTFTVATWNISEGRLARSVGLFDYERKENLDYFVAQLKNINPDIVCLGETRIPHDKNEESLTSRMAKALGFASVHEAPMHHSLTNEHDKLGMGLISSFNFKVQNIPLKQPDFPLVFSNGRPATLHTRWLFVAEFGSFILATTHNWPMREFKYSYDSEPAAGYGKYLDEVYAQELPGDRPLILAGDLNFDSPANVMPVSVRKLKLTEALPLDQPTRPAGDRPDHILFTPEFEILESKIVPGKGDHYLCFAKLQLND